MAGCGCVGVAVDATDVFAEAGRPPGAGKGMYGLAEVLPVMAPWKGGRESGMVGAVFGVGAGEVLLGCWEMSMVPNKSVRGLTRGTAETAELLRMI